MERELNAGLGFLASKLGIEVRLFSDLQRSEWSNPCFSQGPTYHAVDWKRKILWLEPGNQHDEWLHEVAHLACSPPWENGPKGSLEFSGIFAWERAVAEELTRNATWSKEDLDAFLRVQDCYVLGDVPSSWFSQSQNRLWSEWGDLDAATSETILAYSRKTLHIAGMLDAAGKPTFADPTWTAEVEARWQATANFSEGWSVISSDNG